MLRENILGGVGMDVYPNETTLGDKLRNSENWFTDNNEEIAILEMYKLDNVIFTPHNAFNTEEGLYRKVNDTIEQIEYFYKKKMDDTLKDTPWLVGDSYSLADIALVVYLRRMESFMMAPLWKNLKHLNQWYKLISSRPAYIESVTKWGDITEDKRKINGLEAFPTISKFWNTK